MFCMRLHGSTPTHAGAVLRAQCPASRGTVGVSGCPVRPFARPMLGVSGFPVRPFARPMRTRSLPNSGRSRKPGKGTPWPASRQREHRERRLSRTGGRAPGPAAGAIPVAHRGRDRADMGRYSPPYPRDSRLPYSGIRELRVYRIVRFSPMKGLRSIRLVEEGTSPAEPPAAATRLADGPATSSPEIGRTD